MDAKKLEALKQKYAGTKGGEIFHPAFAAVAAQVFSNSDQRKWPFAGAATFLGLPYRPELAAAPDLGGLDVALIGVPMDLGVTNRAGARLGPRAVRAVERIGPYEHALRIAPTIHVSVAEITQSGWCISMPIAIPRASTRAPSFITAVHSGRRCWPACSTRSDRSKS